MATITFEIEDVIVDGAPQVSVECLVSKGYADQSLLIQAYIGGISVIVSDAFESKQFHENVKKTIKMAKSEVIH